MLLKWNGIVFTRFNLIGAYGTEYFSLRPMSPFNTCSVWMSITPERHMVAPWVPPLRGVSHFVDNGHA